MHPAVANGLFVLAILAVTALVVWAHPERRARWRARRADRAARRAVTRLVDADLAALHRQYRTAVRYRMGGHDPAELGPLHVPSSGPRAYRAVYRAEDSPSLLALSDLAALAAEPPSPASGP